MRGINLSFFSGPGVSILKACIPPTPIFGRIAIANTTIPIPPIHWLNERQNKIPFGSDSTSLKILAPVVVRPETDSKILFVKLIFSAGS